MIRTFITLATDANHCNPNFYNLRRLLHNIQNFLLVESVDFVLTGVERSLLGCSYRCGIISGAEIDIVTNTETAVIHAWGCSFSSFTPDASNN